MTKSNLIDIDAKYVHDTPKAWLLDVGQDEPVWIPKSLCEFDRHDGVLTLAENVAIEKGLV